MALNFPNRSRSFDAEHRRIRFAGYDGMFQINFALGVDSIPGQCASADEQSYLAAFDAAIVSIRDAATHSYRKKPRNVVVLTGQDFGS
jgi:hypothetical protein